MIMPTTDTQQAIEEAVGKIQMLAPPRFRPFEVELTPILSSIFTQGRSAGVEECAEIVKGWHVHKGGYLTLADELLKLKDHATPKEGLTP